MIEKLRHALGHKVEGNPKAYTRKLKHPEEDYPETTPWHPRDAAFLLPL